VNTYFLALFTYLVKIKYIFNFSYSFIEMKPCNTSERSMIGMFFEFQKRFNLSSKKEKK
jgi:hypothetical protein